MEKTKQPQLSIFPSEEKQIPDVSKLLLSGRPENIAVAYYLLKSAMSKANALIHIVERLLSNIDWGKAHDEYELNGIMTFVAFSLQSVNVECFDMDGSIYFYLGENGHKTTYWSESDVVGDKMQSKIRKAALDYLRENKTTLNYILP